MAKELIILFLSGALVVNNGCVAQTGTKPLIIGKSDLFHSVVLQEDRVINVYLPEDYKQDDSIKYPVIYVLDGGKDEDFVHITGIVRFNTQPWIARMPASIVVGIEGNVRRRDFTFAVTNLDFVEKEGFDRSGFTHSGGSEKFIRFLETELHPFIENKYSGTGKKTVIGESLSGLLATEILLKRPDLFDDFIIVSPSLWWGEQLLVKRAREFLNSNLKKKVNVYVGAPNREEDVKMFADAEALWQALEGNKNVNAYFDYLPEEMHSTVIHQAVYNAFRTLNLEGPE